GIIRILNAMPVTKKENRICYWIEDQFDAVNIAESRCRAKRDSYLNRLRTIYIASNECSVRERCVGSDRCTCLRNGRSCWTSSTSCTSWTAEECSTSWSGTAGCAYSSCTSSSSNSSNSSSPKTGGARRTCS